MMRTRVLAKKRVCSVSREGGGSERIAVCVCELTPCPNGLVLDSPGIATSTVFLVVALDGMS